MSSNNIIFLTIGTLFFVICISVIYFTKEKIKTNENFLYSILLILCIISCVLEISFGIVFPEHMILLNIFMRIFLFILITWMTLMFVYLFSVIYGDKYVKYKVPLIIIYFLILLFILISVIVLKVDYCVEDDILMYSSGPAVNFAFGFAGITFVGMILLMVINYKKINNKKYIPVITFVLLIILSAIIQKLNPQYIIINFVMGVTLAIMYHTIENPDVKILKLEEAKRNTAVNANKSKSDFLANMSHELRTSLNIVVGLSQDIDSYKNNLPDDVKEDTKDIVNASNTLLEIIGNILDITKIETGKFDIVNTYYNPKEEFNSISKIMRTKVAEKPIKFIVNISDDLPKVLYGDKIRIKQVINNFLSNAIKYTEKGQIEFRVDWIHESSALNISVIDTGNGIKPEDKEKLFSKYERLQIEKKSSVQGTGLGLAITKELIELMNGELNVDSEYGHGSTFNVKLPQIIGDENEFNKLQEQCNFEIEQLDFSGKKVLIVDDYKLNVKVLKKALKNYNLDIEECYDGKETINKIYDGNKYDLILLDVRMPVVSGDRIVKQLKKMKDFDAPIVALTADAMSDSKKKYIEEGFDDYLAKPFLREDIAKILIKYLSK